MEVKHVCKEIIGEIKKRKITHQKGLNSVKQDFARKYNLQSIPTNIQLANYASKEERVLLQPLLSQKPVRTLAGVAPLALFTKPHKCPHGTCTYCPGGPGSPFGDVPQSYTGREPATRRAIRNRYDPYLQVMNRLEHYTVLNQCPEKVEIIIMGGTFPSLSKAYQDTFVTYVFKAMNDFSQHFYKEGALDREAFHAFFELDGSVHDKERQQRIHEKLLALKETSTLLAEQEKNETAQIRCIGLVVETKPDWCLQEHIDQMLTLGCTKVEVGVQSVYEDVISKLKRGHTVQTSKDCTQLLKDAGLKVNYHMMPGLPGVNREQDIAGLRELFTNPDFRPDMLKIYPCMVMDGTELFEDFKAGKFTPITTEQSADIIAEFLKDAPPYVRVMRIQRDIPTYMTEAGVDRTNLRQYVDKIMEERGYVSDDIRAREIGRHDVEGDVEYDVVEYEASDGVEYFIRARIQDALVGFCRLRFPSAPWREELHKDIGIIRELHVYGQATALGEQGKTQHRGIGKTLLQKAEQLCGEKDIAVISGVGARKYYEHLGYHKKGVYMIKNGTRTNQ